MGFIKKNAFFLLCALVAFGSIGLMVWGMSGMSAVRAEMGAAEQLNQSLSRLASSAVGTQAVEAQIDRIRAVRSHHGDVLRHFGDAQERKALLDDVLPEPSKGADDKKLRYDFRTAYIKAMEGLVTRLNAKPVPSRQDIENTEDYLRKRQMEEDNFGTDVPAGGGGTAAGGAGGSAKPIQLPPMDGPSSTEAYWKAKELIAARDHVMLASISRARSIYCYADLYGGSFDLHPIFASRGDIAPSLKEIWDAQVLYWIQEDLVTALASVNTAAAENLEDPWVGNLPVKDVLSIRISEYILPPEGGSRSPGMLSTTQLPPSEADAVWTSQSTHDLYDVINSRLRLVVDVRDLPQVIDALCHNRYYMILNVSYSAVPVDLEFRGKVYGPEPAVQATIDVQTYLYYRSYVPLMPPSVRELLGVENQYQQLKSEREQNAEPEGQQNG